MMVSGVGCWRDGKRTWAVAGDGPDTEVREREVSRMTPRFVAHITGCN